MAAKTDRTAELDRLNALLVWWGIPVANDTGCANGQMKRFQVFASNLQRAYGDEYWRQTGELFTANQRLVLSLQEFLRCRQPQELIAVELDIWMTVLERVAQEAKAWTELTRKVQDCCAVLASAKREATQEDAQANDNH